MESNSIKCLLVHGVGRNNDRSESYNKFVEGIRKYIPLYADITFVPIDYGALLDEMESKIFTYYKKWTYQKIAEFACFYACDVLAYAYPKRQELGGFIFELNDLINKKYDELNPNSKKIIIGHSLGGIIAYGHTWERHYDKCITFGSPFNLFTVRYPNGGEMNPNLKEFYNFYSTKDNISSKISENPNFKMVQDIRVTSWNPFNLLPIRAHCSYWDSDQVHSKIAEILIPR